MNTKESNPRKFINAFKRKTGLYETALQSQYVATHDKDERREIIRRLQDGANTFSFAFRFDKKQLAQCLKHVKDMTASCPDRDKHQQIFHNIFGKISALGLFSKSEKVIKKLLTKEDKALEKRKQAHVKKICKAIETLKALDPDPALFTGTEAHLRKLAQEKAPEPSRYHYLRQHINNRGAFYPSKTRNLKGDESVRLSIFDIHRLLREHKSTLTDNEICTRLSILLTISTGKKYSRQNVYNILSRKPKNPEIPTSAK